MAKKASDEMKENLEEVIAEDIAEDIAEEVEKDPKADWVPVYFPPVRSKDEENFVFVGVNGRRYQIKKGEQVMVPPEVAEVIRNSEREQQRFSERMLERNM